MRFIRNSFLHRPLFSNSHHHANRKRSSRAREQEFKRSLTFPVSHPRILSSRASKNPSLNSPLRSAPIRAYIHRNAMETVVTCKICGMSQRMEELQPGSVAECCRCGTTLAKGKANSISRTAALALAALIFYVPANIYPILRMEYHGAHSENTIWDGIVRLFQDGQWLVAVIVFLASIMIPFLKLLGLFYLVTTARLKWTHRQQERTWVYKIIDVIGPWAMLDVFLLSVLVALVRLKQLASITPGPGLLPFTAVVVLTILASSSFDPKLIWNVPDKGGAWKGGV